MNQSSGTPLTVLKVDGGLTNSQNMVRILSDFVNITVERPLMRETTALGAALAAGLAVGVWASPEEISSKFAEDVEHFVPRMKTDGGLWAGLERIWPIEV